MASNPESRPVVATTLRRRSGGRFRSLLTRRRPSLMPRRLSKGSSSWKQQSLAARREKQPRTSGMPSSRGRCPAVDRGCHAPLATLPWPCPTGTSAGGPDARRTRARPGTPRSRAASGQLAARPAQRPPGPAPARPGPPRSAPRPTPARPAGSMVRAPSQARGTAGVRDGRPLSPQSARRATTWPLGPPPDNSPSGVDSGGGSRANHECGWH